MSHVLDDVWTIVKEFAIDPQYQIFRSDVITALKVIMTYDEARDVYHLLDGIDEEELEEINERNPDSTLFHVELNFENWRYGERRMYFFIDRPVNEKDRLNPNIVYLNEQGNIYFTKDSEYDKLIVQYLHNIEAHKKITIKKS